ncbi:hypothetical protein MBAG_03558, partial [Coprobacillus sp. D7]
MSIADLIQIILSILSLLATVVVSFQYIIYKEKTK